MVSVKSIIYIICLSFCFSGIFVCDGFAADKPIIAIFDFKDANSWQSKNGSIFSSLLMAELIGNDSVGLVEREQIDLIMKERKLNQSGLAGKEYLQIAALLNADYIITGRIYRDEDENEISINLKLIKCSDGKISGKSFSTQATRNNEYLENIAKKAAAFVIKSFKNHK
jgi:curli biogenesis system outer membrane secretion channel CsgG